MATRIKGRVVDYDTDIPVPGVVVLAIGKDRAVFASTTTGIDGIFDMEHSGFDDPSALLEFSHKDYQTQTMRAASANNVDVPLPKPGTLGQVTLTLRRNKTQVALILIVGVIAGYFLMKYKSKLRW